MSKDYPRLTCQPSNAKSYHTEQCRTIKMTDSSRLVSWSLVEWHELDECQYCSGEYEPNKHGATADD